MNRIVCGKEHNVYETCASMKEERGERLVLIILSGRNKEKKGRGNWLQEMHPFWEKERGRYCKHMYWIAGKISVKNPRQRSIYVPSQHRHMQEQNQAYSWCCWILYPGFHSGMAVLLKPERIRESISKVSHYKRGGTRVLFSLDCEKIIRKYRTLFYDKVY